MSTWTGTVNTDWNNVGNWAAGGVGAGIPNNAGVDAIFSGTPTNPCVMGANRICRALSFIGYTSTLTVGTFTLQANNNITFQANQFDIITGTTGRLACNASGTITSNTGIWRLDFVINNVGATITLADDMRVAGSWLGSGGGTVTLAGAFTLFVGTNITTSNSLVAPVTNVVMNGSGTYSGNNAYNLEINTTGNIIITGNVQFTRRFIITAAGSITMTAANVTIAAPVSPTTIVNLGGRTINNLSFNASSSSTVTFQTNLTCNTFSLVGAGGCALNGPGKVFVNGNYILGNNSIGTLIVELIGTGTIGTGILSLPTIIASTGNYILGATLTINNTFTSAIGAILNAGTSTVTINNGVTISTLGLSWNNITIPTGATITINSLLSITGTLLCSGTSTFAGTTGWTTNNFTCTTIGSTITLQNIVAFTSAEYIVNGVLTLIGTAASRIVLQAAGSATFNGTISPVGQLNYLSGTIPSVGMILSQEINVSPVGLIGLLPNRPEITSIITATTFGITPAATTTISPTPISMRAGYKAKFTLFNNGLSSQSVFYVRTQDIDSSFGVSILSAGSNGDDINNSTIALFRTLNWGPLVASSGSVYYTFVN